MIVKMACCDDEPLCLEQLTTIATEWGANQSDKLEITRYNSGQILLDDWNKSGPYHIVFLDIMMPDLNGYETARRLRELDEGALLIFLTGIKEYVFRGYEVSAFRYLLKPIAKNKLINVLDSAFERIHEICRDQLVLKCDDGITCISPSELIYLESEKHYIHVVTTTQGVRCRSRMNDMEKALASHEFIRCHRAYLINLRYVLRINRDDILMRGGKVVPIARNKRKDVREQFLQLYQKRYLG